MHPELLTLPGGYSIKTYGFFMMLAFLSAVWMAMKRAIRVKADPDLALDIALLLLIFGVSGARLFYVVHYWKSQFADAPNPVWAVINITNGGLEFLGGFLGAVGATIIHAFWKRSYSLRLYLDIGAPSAMWGLAIGRIGCFFNGCCFGAVAATGHVPPLAQGSSQPSVMTASVPWAVQFPYHSPAHLNHWERRMVTVPAELVVTPKDGLQAFLLPDHQLFAPVEKRQKIVRAAYDLEQAYKGMKDQESAEARKVRRELEDANKKLANELVLLRQAQSFPSRINPKRETSVSELEQLALQAHSVPVHPAQLYATTGAIILSLLLSAVFYRRKRHGMVIGLLLMLYPVQRTLEEIIRADNPQDVAGLTVSQSISLGLFLLGAVYLFILYKYMSERSPLAVCTPQTPSTSA